MTCVIQCMYCNTLELYSNTVLILYSLWIVNFCTATLLTHTCFSTLQYCSIAVVIRIGSINLTATSSICEEKRQASSKTQGMYVSCSCSVHLFMHTHTCLHICTHTYMHTHMHAHKHAHPFMLLLYL